MKEKDPLAGSGKPTLEGWTVRGFNASHAGEDRLAIQVQK
jgi:hypothetical protein